MAKQLKNLDEALEAQSTAKEKVETAKKALTTYYTKNKLKRNEDYTDDAKHGPAISKLQKAIDKADAVLGDINTQVDSFSKKEKGGKEKAKAKQEKSSKKTKKESSGEGRQTKYEYPEDADTPQKRKAFRVAARQAANSGKEAPKTYADVLAAKEAKPKKEKKAKEEKPAKEKKEAKPAKEAKKEKSSKKEKAAPVKEEKPAKKKKTKKVEDD